MDARYTNLSEALAGYKKTGIPLIAFNGTVLRPAGYLDDLGSYYLIPRLAIVLRLPLERATDLFYFSLLALACVIGMGGFLASLTTTTGKWLAPIWIAIVIGAAYQKGDVYIVSAFLPLTFAPWLLFLSHQRPHARILHAFLFLEGLLIGVAHTVRAHSGTALLLFTLAILLFQIDVRKGRKVWLTALLLSGLLIPQFYLRLLVARRDAFLATACPACPRRPAQHPFWHSVYIGFGFLSNNYVPSYNDAVAFDRVQTIAPGTLVGSADYERVLRREVFALVREHPLLVASTVAAKTGVILFVLVATANVGLLAALRYRKPWPIDRGFWAAIAFSSLPGLLAKPTSFGYLLGLVTFTSLYAINSIDFALSAGAGRDLRSLLHRLVEDLATPFHNGARSADVFASPESKEVRT